MSEKEIIARTKTLLQAYVDMFDNNYGKLLSQCATSYDDTECDSHCLKDDMETLIDDIECWEEQYEEQESFLKLPCKVGDSIWVNGILGCGEAEEYKVIRVDYHSTLETNRNEFYIEALLAINPIGGSIGFYDKEFGKTVFLTKEAAEQALAEMKEV